MNRQPAAGADARRITDKMRAVAIVWNWLRKAHAPDEVKSAFRSLVIKHIVTTTDDNLEFWQPKYAEDEYLEW